MGGRYRGEEEVRLNGQHLGGAWGAGRRSRGRVLVWWTAEHPGEHGRPKG